MSDNISTQKIEIVYETISDTAKKSNKLNYERIKELCTEAQAIRVLLHQTQSQDVIDRLQTFIEELNKLKKSYCRFNLKYD